MSNKKKVTELTDKEAIKKLFPKKVVEEAERVAHEKEKLNPSTTNRIP